MCVDMRVDMCADSCVDMCPDMCVDMCADMCVDMRVDMCVHTPFENSRREFRMEPPPALAHAKLDTAFGDADVVLIARLARARSCVPLAPASPIVFCACSVVPHPDPTTNESRGRGHRHANIVVASRGSAMLKIASRMPSIAFLWIDSTVYK